MSKIAVLLWACDLEQFEHNANEFRREYESVELFCCGKAINGAPRYLGMSPQLGSVWRALVEETTAPVVFVQLTPGLLTINQDGTERLLEPLRTGKTWLSYSAHHYHCPGGGAGLQPLIDYQLGSVRDDFEFGPLVALAVPELHRAVDGLGLRLPADDTGWYALRLALASELLPFRIAEPVYEASVSSGDSEVEHFAYVTRAAIDRQQRLEQVFTDIAIDMGVYLAGPRPAVDVDEGDFKCEASVIIPVRNRCGTIEEAVQSALYQEASFAFNVIVVDNFSDDGTGAILDEIANQDSRLIHYRPIQPGLKIGGCWNEAIHHPDCGRFCVQLDSDDLYESPDVLERVVATFRKERAAVVVGSYTVVDEHLHPIDPGLVDHREWTPENGHNNALRINGFGAPRAFFTPLVRGIGFPDLSYGEDYAVMLAISRQWRVARIYDSLYLCRRWSGNSDAAPTIAQINHFNQIKDDIRTSEIEARRFMIETRKVD